MSKQTGNAAGIPHARVSQMSEIPAALDALALRRGRPVLVLVGGAGGMDQDHLQMLATVLQQVVLPLLDRRDAAVVDGGTDSGVMRVIGQTRASGGERFPLVGVAAEGTVVVPDQGSPAPDAAQLEPNHTHVVLVPGATWGDESPWLANVADVIADGCPSVTLVVNGGEITYDDVAGSLARRRPVVVLDGTGRTADAIAAACEGQGGHPRAMEIAASPLTRVVAVWDAEAIGDAIAIALDAHPTSRP